MKYQTSLCFLALIVTPLTSQTYVWQSCKLNFAWPQIVTVSLLKSKVSMLGFRKNVWLGMESIADKD